MKDSKEGEKEQPMEGEKKKFAVDPDSGMVFELKPQGPLDIAVARSSYVYLLLMLAFFFWLLFDIWMGRHTLAHVLGYQPVERLDTPTFRLMAYTVIGGGMGGIICGIRSILIWHGDLEAFGGRFLWKYITSPWLGATLALFVYAVIRGGIAAFGGGDYTTQAAGTNQSFAALGVGVLAGYGSRKVLTWLDGLVKRMFKGTLTVPVPGRQEHRGGKGYIGMRRPQGRQGDRGDFLRPHGGGRHCNETNAGPRFHHSKGRRG